MLLYLIKNTVFENNITYKLNTLNNKSTPDLKTIK